MTARSKAPINRRDRRYAATPVALRTALAACSRAAAIQPFYSPRPFPHAVDRPRLAVFPHGL